MLNKQLTHRLLNTLLAIGMISAANAQSPSPTGKTKVVVIPLFESAPEPEPEPPEVKLVFVSATRSNANFGGPEEADALCQADADADGSLVQGKSFKAWLSNNLATDFSNSGRVFRRSQVPYHLINGAKVADNFEDLVANFPDAPINIRPDGTRADPRTTVWTGVLADGEFSTLNCNNWRSSGIQSFGRRGNLGVSQSSEWTNSGTSRCDIPGRVYCFEQ